MRKLLAAALVVSFAFSADAQTIATSNVRNGLLTFQVKITASAQAFPSFPIRNGLTCTAKTGNTGSIELGVSTVTTTADGTGAGYILAAGSSVTLLIQDSKLAYVIGTANDVISCVGN